MQRHPCSHQLPTRSLDHRDGVLFEETLEVVPPLRQLAPHFVHLGLHLQPDEAPGGSMRGRYIAAAVMGAIGTDVASMHLGSSD